MQARPARQPRVGVTSGSGPGPPAGPRARVPVREALGGKPAGPLVRPLPQGSGMTLVLSLLAVALLVVQLGLAIEPRREKPPQPAEPTKASPVRVATDIG